MASVTLNTDNKGLTLSRSAVCDLLTHPWKGKMTRSRSFLLLRFEALVFVCVCVHIFIYSIQFPFKCAYMCVCVSLFKLSFQIHYTVFWQCVCNCDSQQSPDVRHLLAKHTSRNIFDSHLKPTKRVWLSAMPLEGQPLKAGTCFCT